MKRISIITGGSSGLGKELVRELINKNMNVCIIARDEKKIEETKKELGGNIVSFSGYLEDESFVELVFACLKKDGYYVDYLYNCAGIGLFGEPQEMNLKKVQEVFNSNVIGLMCITYEACRNMIDGGTIVNIASTAGLKGNPKESLYCASKWAVRGFTESLRAYYKNSSIHVVGVYPGGINTSFWNQKCGLTPDVSKFMDPREVAKVIVYNAIEKSSLYSSDITIERK